MKVHIILDDSLTNKIINLINVVDNESIIIFADKLLYNKLKKENPEKKFIWIDLFDENDSNEKVNMANDIAKDLIKINPKLLYKGYNLSELTVNPIYYNFISILFNLISKLDNFIKSNKITSITLYGGAPTEQYLGLTLSEGERPFQLLYKRSWYFNYFINQAFKEKYKIEWKNKTPKLYLKIMSYIKPKIIISGKLILLMKKFINKNGNKKLKNQELKENLYTLLMVRNPIQVEPLKPIYYEYEKRQESTPLYLSFENYSNNKLEETLNKNNVRYFNLYELSSFKSLFSIFNQLKKIKKSASSKNLNKSIKGNNIEINFDKLSNELSVYWFDILLLIHLLEEFDNKITNKINNVINNETHGYYSAVETEWARRHGVSSAGIQHVSISDVMLPRISRVDVMFMMSRKITDLLARKKVDEKFIFVGPVAYDNFFDKSKHTDQFNKIVIFSQPDDFKKDYFRIIEDVIDIVKKNKLDIEIILKLHPREKDIQSFLKFDEIFDKFKVVTDEVSSSELIVESDLVLSIHSGTLMQSILIGTPSISINYDERHKIHADYILDDVTTKVISKKELEEKLLNLKLLNEDFYYNRKIYLKDKLENYNGNAAGKVYDYIKNL